MIPDFLLRLGIPCTLQNTDCLLLALGMKEEHICSSRPLAQMDFASMGVLLCQILSEMEYKVAPQKAEKLLQELYLEKTKLPEAQIVPIGDLKRLFDWLRDREIYIGLAVSEDRRSAVHSLQKLGIAGYFDYIGTAGARIRPKPSQDIFIRFQKKYQLLPGEIAVVGDSRIDMEFAHNSRGISIGVLSGVDSYEELFPTADFIYSEVFDIMTHWPELNQTQFQAKQEA